jgi:hypothetical protein
MYLGVDMAFDSERDRIALPPRIFMYTIDQIAMMLEVEEKYIKQNLLHYEHRSPGICPKSKMRAVNLAAEGDTPQWRVTENTLLGFLRRRGVRFYTPDRGY